VLRYVEDVREGAPIADLATVVSGRIPAAAAAAAVDQLPGWLLYTDNASLASRLIGLGATRKRQASVMQCDLRADAMDADVTDDRFTLAPLPTDPASAHWAAILPSWRAAFPADHPDHFDGDDRSSIAFLMRLVDGSELGPLHRSTTLLVRRNRPVAGIVVNVRPQEPPRGGAWIADLWRDPSLRGSGVGPLLIRHAKRLLREDGHHSLTLAVSAGNPARATYAAEGFRAVLESHTVLLPRVNEVEMPARPGSRTART
jgi:ribosomal protein S18 acetylase RimI-like enzyme